MRCCCLQATVIFARMSAAETFIVSQAPAGQQVDDPRHLLLRRHRGGRDPDTGQSVTQSTISGFRAAFAITGGIHGSGGRLSARSGS